MAKTGSARAWPAHGAGASDAVALATSSPEHLAAAAQAAISAARAGVAALTARPTATVGRSTPLAPLEAHDELEAHDKLEAHDELEAYDEAVAALADAANRFELIALSHPDAAMRAAADAAKQEIARTRTEISLDRGLYDVISAVDVSGTDDATRHYHDRILRDFRRAGVDRDGATRARIRALQDELVALGQDFDRNIRTDTRCATFPPRALAGLPEDYVRAHPVGDDGVVSISTDYPDIIPFLTYCRDAAARERMWRLYRQRAYPSNVDVLRRMIERRHELATLLGYPSWAQYVTEDKMIGSAGGVAGFIERIAAAAAERAQLDYDRLLARKRIDQPDAQDVLPWDSAYLDDRLKAEELAFDTRSLRPYFEYGRVKAGLMALVERLFGVRFRPRTDIRTWHSEVECYDVLDNPSAEGRLLGRIFLDMHPRPDKYNHAAMFAMTTGKAGVRLAECALVCNLPRPDDQPALLQHSDVETFFHEFGHLIHHIFAGQARWAGISGIATEWDFVEAPSQLLEEWVRDAATLATFAVHHETGQPLPAEMVAKLRQAEEFGKGLYVRQQMFYAALSLELHRRDPAGLDPLELERRAQERYTPYRHVDGTYMHLSFGHLDGYSAIYYTYMWSLVIAKDLFTAFERDGLLNPRAAARYRAQILAPGGAAPAADLVRSFLGRPYDFTAYQAWLNAP